MVSMLSKSVLSGLSVVRPCLKNVVTRGTSVVLSRKLATESGMAIKSRVMSNVGSHAGKNRGSDDAQWIIGLAPWIFFFVSRLGTWNPGVILKRELWLDCKFFKVLKMEEGFVGRSVTTLNEETIYVNIWISSIIYCLQQNHQVKLLPQMKSKQLAWKSWNMMPF